MQAGLTQDRISSLVDKQSSKSLQRVDIEEVSPFSQVSNDKVYLCYSRQQGSAPKHAVGWTWAATAATVPCLGKSEIRLHRRLREVRSMVTPASRSPTCEVSRAVGSLSHQLQIEPHHGHLVSVVLLSFCEDKLLQDREHFLNGKGFFLQVSCYKRTSLKLAVLWSLSGP